MFVDGRWALMVETGYMSLLGEIGAAARYHLYWTHTYFFIFFFTFLIFSSVLPLALPNYDSNAPRGNWPRAATEVLTGWGNSPKWFSCEKFKNTATGTVLPSCLHTVDLRAYRTAGPSLAECGAPAAPSLTMRDFQSGVISLPRDPASYTVNRERTAR